MDSLQVIRHLEGQHFGKWIVLKRSQKWISPTNHRPYQTWLCQCSCGTIRNVIEPSLIQGKSTNCGCENTPSMERYVRKYLDDHDISYIPQFRFKTLRGVGGGQLSYDFAVLNNTDNVIQLIECQGKQHYQPIEHFGGTEVFKKQQIHDYLKSQYAKDHLIPLCCIKYEIGSNDQIIKILDRLFYNLTKNNKQVS